MVEVMGRIVDIRDGVLYIDAIAMGHVVPREELSGDGLVVDVGSYDQDKAVAMKAAGFSWTYAPWCEKDEDESQDYDPHWMIFNLIHDSNRSGRHPWKCPCHACAQCCCCGDTVRSHGHPLGDGHEFTCADGYARYRRREAKREAAGIVVAGVVGDDFDDSSI